MWDVFLRKETAMQLDRTDFLFSRAGGNVPPLTNRYNTNRRRALCWQLITQSKVGVFPVWGRCSRVLGRTNKPQRRINSMQ